MFALAIDTSSPAVTAAVVTVTDGEVALAAARVPLAARGHGELLTPSIAGVLDDAGLAPRDLDAVVVGVGPGPFTGLRVGLVTAAALAHAVDVPAYGVCSLDAIGVLYPDDPALLVATDARRSEVYWARYEFGRRVGDPGVARPADVPTDGLSAVAGAGAELHAEAWPGLDRRPGRYPDPVALVGLAAERIGSAAPSDPLTPLYLRRPDAVVPGAPKAVRQ
ncbi:tRNA (adenosine(37)-N6)-threonylcarbamoyltransferase complex dimerization subunit type 1 TsaB [uncultured Jatrophihabitans sp.]|uniref:tRNA (adenosine(37)-N6)-threonylcarbamoyltransferase complex dimerization subunit type 1 TsaB n=1 Tax=uncultured Jatrophihabitans sp. TaxID=1610747 RepID=UPI0035CB4057